MPKLKKVFKKMLVAMILISGMVFTTIYYLAVQSGKGFIPLPIGVRHFFHLISAPKDMYHPIITDNYLFHKQGFSKTYFLKPKYLDIYEIGFISKAPNQIYSNYRFKGEVRVEFFYKEILLFDKVIKSTLSANYSDKDMGHYRSVSLLTFQIPLNGKYKNNISLRLTVVQPDVQLKSYANSIILYIAVSAIP